MVQSGAAPESRWVIRLLWLIAAALAATILTIRTHGIVSPAQLAADGHKPSAGLTFTLPVAGLGLHNFDSIAWADHPPAPLVVERPPVIAAGSALTLRGWAVDREAKAPFAAIGAKVDGLPLVFSAVIGIPRPDVAAALGITGARYSGFVLDVDTAHLGPGRHLIAVRALRGGDARSVLELGAPIAFEIRQRSDALQRTDSIDAINGVLVNDANAKSSGVTVLRSYHKLTVYGWAFITDGDRLANTAALLVDGNPVASATYGLSRPDVAKVFHDVRLTRSGFIGTISTDSLAAGPHVLTVQMSSNDGSTVESSSELHINVQ
jgi:hypothetical protein